ncbi:MAG: hypothetical protein JWQ90_2448 [Hydrocarboniphaga sp.]|uniref:VOC family protein n=1 Tax=Hydrocarboniphaga sp. TaxID=2033016 RepID=UPI0026347AC5|nr:VOC family protein [Hydrocarboniphaga sp.]MDB5969998.1 hypothetical protein [Hydrocarboniphaga sp.]
MKSDIQYPGSEHRSAAAVAAAGTIRIDRMEAIVKADAVAYILFNKNDLEKQKQFLADFGMHLAAQTADTVYMRGVGTLPYIYAAYDFRQQKKALGKAARSGYIGIGFSFNSESDLTALSRATGMPIETIDGPGGGQRVRLHDPDGFIADAVWGRTPVERFPTQSTLTPINTPFEKPRINCTVRPVLQPSPVERVGHAVLSVSNFRKSLDWYMTHFGLIPTDVQCLEDGTPALSFNRLDRGKEPTDHHSLVLMQNVAAQYMHSAYETFDLDSVGQGQQYLSAKGWKHHWGIGRHILGSQIFDYWLDPEGEEVEHYADGDLFDAGYETGYHPLDMGGLWAWGDDVPDMAPKMTPKQIIAIVKAIRSGNLSGKTLGMIKKAMSTQARPWVK